MTKLERNVNRVYTLGGLVLLTIVIIAMSSCGSSKEYHIGTGQELSRSNCSGNYINR